MLKCVILAKIIMNETENFHEIGISGLNLGRVFGYKLKIVFHIILPFFFPSRPFGSAELNHCIILTSNALVKMFLQKGKTDATQIRFRDTDEEQVRYLQQSLGSEASAGKIKKEQA